MRAYGNKYQEIMPLYDSTCQHLSSNNAILWEQMPAFCKQLCLSIRRYASKYRAIMNFYEKTCQHILRKNAFSMFGHASIYQAYMPFYEMTCQQISSNNAFLWEHWPVCFKQLQLSLRGYGSILQAIKSF